MMNLPDIDALARDKGWTGIVVHCAGVSFFYIIVNWLPQIYTWFAATFLSRQAIIDERRHEVVMYLADFLLVITLVFSVISAIRLLRNQEK